MEDRGRVALASMIVCAVAMESTWGQTPIVPPNEKFEMITTEVDFAEGPSAGVDGAIYFSDIPTGPKKGRILRYDPASRAISVFQADSKKSNGTFVDAKGRLVVCEGADHGGRRIARYLLDGNVEVLADNFMGKKFNAPNDLCVDPAGRVWFSDPKYLGDEPRELDHRSVYRIDPDGMLHLAITQPAIQKPNGVHVSIDGTTLYVADTNNEPAKTPDGKEVPGAMQLVAFEVRPDGSIGGKRVLVDFAPEQGVDGMTLDEAGNIYAAVRTPMNPAIRVYNPDGKELARIPTPDVPSNCVFGRGAEQNRLYVTMDKGFGRIRLNAKGYHLPPQ